MAINTQDRRGMGAPPSRAKEFELYKQGRGIEMNRALTDNKGKCEVLK